MVANNFNNLFCSEMEKKKTLNELRQTKEYYKHPYEPVVNGIKYLCAIYPNNADLGAAVREHFQIHKDERK
tara:strand:- start:146 stop:358 length:213 start_codon:yes stop_codon:yes gene_type:complete